jgi:hypothetical protein
MSRICIATTFTRRCNSDSTVESSKTKAVRDIKVTGANIHSNNCILAPSSTSTSITCTYMYTYTATTYTLTSYTITATTTNNSYNQQQH